MMLLIDGDHLRFEQTNKCFEMTAAVECMAKNQLATQLRNAEYRHACNIDYAGVCLIYRISLYNNITQGMSTVIITLNYDRFLSKHTAWMTNTARCIIHEVCCYGVYLYCNLSILMFVMKGIMLL